MPGNRLLRIGKSPLTTGILGAIAVVVAGLNIRPDRLSDSGDGPAWKMGQATSGHDTDGETTTGSVFTDVAGESGLDFVHVNGVEGKLWLPELMGSGGAFLDYDDDGDLDIYLVQSGVVFGSNDEHRNRLYRNDGAGRFVDVSAASGADVPGYGMGCAAADYDNDGDVDLYVTRLGPNVLLRNNGDGTFSDVTHAAGVGDEGFGTGAAFLDYDRDGLMDLYVVNYVDWSPQGESACYDARGIRDYCGPGNFDAPSRDRLYRSTGDGRFEDVSERSGIAGAVGNGLGVLCSDFDGDGWVDIYVANDQSPGFFWHNQRDGTFLEEGAIRGCAFNGDGVLIAGMGVVSEDLDDDGDYDLLVTNIRDQVNLCLRNDGGYFADVSHAWGFAGWNVPFTGFGIGLFDQDNDGVWDCFVANGVVNRLMSPRSDRNAYAEPNRFVRGDGSGRFVNVVSHAGSAIAEPMVSRGTILGDYDNDGDVDVLVTNNGGPVQLLRNDDASKHAWIVLDLVPDTGARHALHARVVLYAGGRTFRREVRPHAGYLGSNDPRVHIGLGGAERVDRLEITWPGGDVEVWEGLSVRRHYRLKQHRAPEAASASRTESGNVAR